MAEFKTKAEYEKWKAERGKAASQRQEEIPPPALSDSGILKNKLYVSGIITILFFVGLAVVYYFMRPSVGSNLKPGTIHIQSVGASVPGSMIQPVAPQVVLTSEERQIATEALKALKKFQARCQVGISYREYPTVLGDVKYAVNTLKDHESSKKITDFSMAIIKAMGHYEFAHTVWGNKFAGSGVKEYISDSRVVKLIIDVYPLVGKPMDEGGADDVVYGERLDTYNRKIASIYNKPLPDYEKQYFIERIISIIWGEASKEIEKASAIPL